MQNGREIFFSMNEFCHRYASSQGGRYATDILNVLFDLQETWVAREIDGGKVEYFQILGDIKIHQGRSWPASACTCSPPSAAPRRRPSTPTSPPVFTLNGLTI